MPRRRMRQPEPVTAQPASTAKPQVELSAYALRDTWLGIFPPNVWPRPGREHADGIRGSCSLEPPDEFRWGPLDGLKNASATTDGAGALRRGVGDTAAAAARRSAPPPLPSAVALDLWLALRRSPYCRCCESWEQDYAARVRVTPPGARHGVGDSRRRRAHKLPPTNAAGGDWTPAKPSTPLPLCKSRAPSRPPRRR